MSYEEIQEDKEVECRKPHWSGWCGERIEKGEKAISRKYKFNGELQNEHQHTECHGAMIKSSGDIDDGYECGQFMRGKTVQEWEEKECGGVHGSMYDCGPELALREQHKKQRAEMLKNRSREEFEGYILNNRMDDPGNSGIQVDGITDAYIDQRIQYGWVCWKAAKGDYSGQS